MINHILFFVFLATTVIVAIFVVVPALLNFATLFIKEKNFNYENTKENSIACVITAYKNTEITENLVASLLKQDYSNFHIFLIADNCEIASYPITDSRLTVSYPRPALLSKSKSIKLALDNASGRYDYTIIFDPDNLVKTDFLSTINQFLLAGYSVVQGKRTAKNLDSTYACLDAMSDFYYNHSQRMVPYLLGGSATIAGSGMCLKTSIYNDFFEKEDLDKHIIAEDKLLQIYVVDDKSEKIAYAGNALVYDEKVSTGEQVQRQRTRWIASFFQYFSNGLKLFIKGLAQFNFNKILFGYTIIIPPLFILGAIAIFQVFVSIFISMNAFVISACCFIVFLIHFFLCLNRAKAPEKVISAVFSAPVFVFRQIAGMLDFKKTKTDFLVTEKKHTKSIDEILNQ